MSLEHDDTDKTWNKVMKLEEIKRKSYTML
jgi:hypothetical protein